jgi:hypothetical protein
MNEQKGFIVELAELIDRHLRRHRRQAENTSKPRRLRSLLHWLMPNSGTLLLVAMLILTTNVWAKPLLSPASAPGPSATTVNYQGRRADSSGNPLSGTITFQFALYDSDTGGNRLWGPETPPNVPVSAGLFSVRQGSQTTGGTPDNLFSGGDVWLETIIEGETLSPREKLTAVPYAIRSSQSDFSASSAWAPTEVGSGQATTTSTSFTTVPNMDISFELTESRQVLLYSQVV